MKFRICSDLHLELNSSKENPFILPHMDEDKETILILAGDICVINDLTLAIPFFADVCMRFKHIFYVFGNHEFYRSKMDEVYNKFYNQIAKYYYNLTVSSLDPVVTKIGNYKFILATMWTGWNHPQQVLHTSNEYSMFYCKKSMGDFFVIKDRDGQIFTPQKSKEIHQEHIKFIEKELQMRDYDKSIVITHHAPSLKSIHTRYFRDPLNPAFSSDLSSFWEKYKPDLLVHGHCHNSFNYMENEKTQVICNPKGYGGENPNFYPYLKIEL